MDVFTRQLGVHRYPSRGVFADMSTITMGSENTDVNITFLIPSYKSQETHVVQIYAYSKISSLFAERHDVQNLQAAAATLEKQFPYFPIPWQALATFAISKGNGVTFSYCLDQAATIGYTYSQNCSKG